MRIVNQTEWDGRAVSAIVRRVAKDLEVQHRKDFTVVVRRRLINGVYSGRFSGSRRLITLTVSSLDSWPRQTTHGYVRADVPPEHICHSWQEALASIAGHELMHLRQYDRWTRGKKGNNHGRFNEVETQFAEYRAWQREAARRAA